MHGRETPDLYAVMKRAIEHSIADLHVSLPASVESYDSINQKASVHPLLKKEYADGEIASMPVIVNVPVMFPSSNNAILSMPISKGDTGLIIFSERSLDTWLSIGGEVEPKDPRTHDLSDAIFIPGLYPFDNNRLADPDSVVLLHNDILLKLQNDNKVAMGTASVEVLDVISQALNLLVNTTVFTGDAGTQPLSSASSLSTLKTQIDSIKGTI